MTCKEEKLAFTFKKYKGHSKLHDRSSKANAAWPNKVNITELFGGFPRLC
jgi:hypothetical protein